MRALVPGRGAWPRGIAVAALAAASLACSRPSPMVYVTGGDTPIGSVAGEPDEQPPWLASVATFELDRAPVTVGEFAAFVARTGYRTQAERFGSAGVFRGGAWSLMDGATWRYPQGPDGPRAPRDHPVTQVSWHDATAYCAASRKRLPTEVEYERAVRLGGEAQGHGRYHANTWQGPFPARNTGDDGYLTTSPVGAFGANALGLVDLTGNVWEWTADWYRPYAERWTPFTPDASSERASRGGSFLCSPGWCRGYRASARAHATPDTSLQHTGFRCARSID